MTLFEILRIAEILFAFVSVTGCQSQGSLSMKLRGFSRERKLKLCPKMGFPRLIGHRGNSIQRNPPIFLDGQLPREVALETNPRGLSISVALWQNFRDADLLPALVPLAKSELLSFEPMPSLVPTLLEPIAGNSVK